VLTGAPGSRSLSLDGRVFIFALLAGVPGSFFLLGWLFANPHDNELRWTLSILIVGLWLGLARAAQMTVVRPMQTVSNLLAALREEDFSFRARGRGGEDALSQVLFEVNTLAETLKHQRLGALEATGLLRSVMEEIDVAVFAFDEGEQLRLVNRAGEGLLGFAAERALGRTATDLGLGEALRGEAPRVMDAGFAGRPGRFEVRRSLFRQGGRPHHLLVLTNVSRALRDEERQAWQRLIRVIGHELNNSLAPIQSIAGSLGTLLSRTPRPSDFDDDLRRGLAVIASRSESLARFTEAYARLARLPAPALAPVDVAELVRRVTVLESRHGLVVEPGPPITLVADATQLEQALINLIRNGVEAAQEMGGGVRLSWRVLGPSLEILVEDEGPGLPTTSNLFVPFFSTKPGGSGIGLVLTRQIAEGHGGLLTLENRGDRHGVRARLRLPLPKR
jgi:two-component system nitrogen regulation sensor histidine kinase NtrY